MTLEKYIEQTRPIFCYVFQNLRLGSINFTRLFRLRVSTTLCSPNEDFGRHNKKDRACVFDAIFKASSPKSSNHTRVKYFENACPIFSSVVQNLRLGSIDFARLVQRSCKPWILPTGLGWIGYAILFCNRLQYRYKKIASDPSSATSPLFWTISISNRRVPLIPLFYKPAFSRFSQNGEPRVVGVIFGTMV